MGLGSSKKHLKANKLKYYETSDEVWVFGSEHIAAIKSSLDLLGLSFTSKIILRYVGNVNSVKWSHPNYTTYIHTKRTPLNNNTTPLCPDWLDTLYVYGDLRGVKVVILGGGGVGKSAIIIKLLTGNFLEEHDDYGSSIEDSYFHKLTINVPADEYDSAAVACNNAQNVFLDILDATLIEEFSLMLDQWIREGHIFLLVFSVVNERTFEEIQRIRQRIFRCKDTKDLEEECDYAMVAVGNKCDLRVDGDVFCNGHGGGSGRDVNMDEVNDWCIELGIPYIETSAKSGKNIHFLFRQAVYELYEKTKHLGRTNAI